MTTMDATAGTLRQRYLALLDANEDEQVYQAFLEEHTQFIPREFVQNHGIHFDLVLRKLGFGTDYKCDFFYMSKSSDSWHLVFVEIEKPQSRYFKGSSNDLHPNFVAALQQINRWRAWLSETDNLAALLVALGPMYLPLTMRRNPSYPKFVLVHGRRGEYHASDQRRSIVRAEEREDVQIMSFDSLAEGLERKDECYIGARRNEFIEIFDDRIIAPELFGWIEPSQFKVSASLRDALRDGYPQGPHIHRWGNSSFVDALPWVAERIRV